MHSWELHSLDGGETRPAPWIGRDEMVKAWSPDGRHAFVGGWLQPPFRVFRVDVATGRREPWLDTNPPDPAGIDQTDFSGTALTPDGRYYAYAYLRTLSDLGRATSSPERLGRRLPRGRDLKPARAAERYLVKPRRWGQNAGELRSV